MKYCIKCNDSINEKDKNLKWCMFITKKGEKIIEFECFHEGCWRDFWEESVERGIEG